MVVYHLHGQTGRFMVWVNGSQSSGLVNFVPSIAFTIGTISTNQFHLPENGREGLKLVSRMALKKWNTNFRLEYSIRKNRTTFSDVPFLPEIFRREDTKSRFPFTFQPDFPENYSVKQPMRTEQSRPWKGIRIAESGKILLMESGILGIGIRNTTQEIRNPTNDWHPESKFYWQIVKSWPVSGIRNPQRGIQNPRLSWIPTYMGREQHWTFDPSYAFLPRDQTRNILQNIVNSENIRMFPFSSSVQS